MRVVPRAGVCSVFALSAAACLLFLLPAQAQQPAPDQTPPTIHQIDVYNGPIHTTSYFSKGASPHLLSVYRQLGLAENEYELSKELGILKREYVKNERQLEARRTALQLWYGGYGVPGVNLGYGRYGSTGSFGGFGYGGYRGYGGFGYGYSSPIKNMIVPLIGQAATPTYALQAILNAELAQEQVNAEKAKLQSGGKSPAVSSTSKPAPFPLLPPRRERIPTPAPNPLPSNPPSSVGGDFDGPQAMLWNPSPAQQRWEASQRRWQEAQLRAEAARLRGLEAQRRGLEAQRRGEEARQRGLEAQERLREARRRLQEAEQRRLAAMNARREKGLALGPRSSSPVLTTAGHGDAVVSLVPVAGREPKLPRFAPLVLRPAERATVERILPSGPASLAAAAPPSWPDRLAWLAAGALAVAYGARVWRVKPTAG